MADKQVALGTILKTDSTQGGTFVEMTIVESITPSPRERETVEGKTLGDTLDVPLMGIEGPSVMEFAQHWEPGDTEHEKLDTLFDSKDEFDVQIVTPHATPVTDEFSGKVLRLAPETLETSGAYRRTVAIQRTTDITRT